MSCPADAGVVLVAHGTVENLEDLGAFVARIRHEWPMPERICLMRTVPDSGRFCFGVLAGPFPGCQTNVRGIYTASFDLARER